jgi:EpsI family protein
MKKFVILLALLIPFGLLAITLRYLVVEPKQPSSLASMPLQIGDWKGQDVPVSQATASVLQATEVLLRDYTSADGAYLGLFIAYFRDQKYGSQIHSPRHCVPGGGWVVEGLERVPFDLGVRQITVNRMTIANKAEVNQMFYWFHTRSGDLASEYALKFDLVRNSLLFSPTDAVIIRLTVSQRGKTPAECQRVAERFMQDILGDVRKSLPFATL